MPSALSAGEDILRSQNVRDAASQVVRGDLGHKEKLPGEPPVSPQVSISTPPLPVYLTPYLPPLHQRAARVKGSTVRLGLSFNTAGNPSAHLPKPWDLITLDGGGERALQISGCQAN